MRAAYMPAPIINFVFFSNISEKMGRIFNIDRLTAWGDDLLTWENATEAVACPIICH